jgi:ABC-type multidrug transport system ATPase subunit
MGHVADARLQDDAFFDDLSCEDQLLFWGRFKGIPRQILRSQVRARLREVRLDQKLWHEHPSSFSGGEQRLVSVAISVVRVPKVLFWDEPTTGLDIHARRRLVTMLKQVKEGRKEGGSTQRCAVVITTHSPTEVEEVADHIVVLASGETLSRGTPNEIKEDVWKRVGGIEMRTCLWSGAMCVFRHVMHVYTSTAGTLHIRAPRKGTFVDTATDLSQEVLPSVRKMVEQPHVNHWLLRAEEGGFKIPSFPSSIPKSTCSVSNKRLMTLEDSILWWFDHEDDIRGAHAGGRV